MQFHKYNGKQVEVVRVFNVGKSQFVDLRNPQTGKIYSSVPMSDFKNEPGKVVFENVKNGKKVALLPDSPDYDTFVKTHKLNPLFIDNCLKGISKTHKGFKIYQK